MNDPIDIRWDPGDRGDRLSPAAELAILARALHRDGYDDHLAGHVSYLQPDRTLLVNPFELAWDEVRASDIMTIDLDGNVCAGRWTVNPAIELHLAVHRHRTDVTVAIHNHPRWATTWAGAGRLPPIYDQTSAQMASEVALVTEYGGVVTSREHADDVAAGCGTAGSALLADHGVLVFGETIRQAYLRAITLEWRSCQAWHVEALGASTQLDPVAAQAFGARMERKAFPGLFEAMARREIRHDSPRARVSPVPILDRADRLGPAGSSIFGLFEVLAAEFAERTLIVCGPERWSWQDVRVRAHGLARGLLDRGIGVRCEREHLADWESGQDHVALIMRNRPEYVVAMLGSFAARAVPFNVNFRYTLDELVEVLGDARPRVVVVDSEFATIAAHAAHLAGTVDLVLQIPDGSATLVPGCVWLDDARHQSSSPVDLAWAADDLYMLYTGGTTGRPKGVLWRGTDALAAAFGVVDRDGVALSYDSARDRASAAPHRTVVVCPPLIHGAAQWSTFATMFVGGTIVLLNDGAAFEAGSVLDAVEREGATDVLVVGDAFARAIADAVVVDERSFTSWTTLVNGGAALSASVRRQLQTRLPQLRVVDSIGASETGRQTTCSYRQPDHDARHVPLSGTTVLSMDRRRALEPGDLEVGWLARTGFVPLGYLNDPVKTAATFVHVDGVRYVVPGDRARRMADGSIDFLGRESTTINTGGEKVFSEEVEAVLSSHPDVLDCVVLGRPSERWGATVVALVRSRSAALTSASLQEHVRTRLAGYKVPRQIHFVDAIPRTPAGKADHRGAHLLWDSLEVQDLARTECAPELSARLESP